MTSRFSVTLNGTSLNSVDNSILIRDISYHSPQINFDTTAVAKREVVQVDLAVLTGRGRTIHEQSRTTESLCPPVRRVLARPGLREGPDAIRRFPHDALTASQALLTRPSAPSPISHGDSSPRRRQTSAISLSQRSPLFRNGWRKSDGNFDASWLRSDIRAVAYFFNHCFTERQ